MTETLVLVWDPVLEHVKFGCPFLRDFGKSELKTFILNALVENVLFIAEGREMTEADAQNIRKRFEQYCFFTHTVDRLDPARLWVSSAQSELDSHLERMELVYKIRFLGVDFDAFPREV